VSEILLGSVALEPNRWRTLDPSGAPKAQLSEWVAAIADAGFDGLELWDRHLTAAAADEASAILAASLPIQVFNSYASLDATNPQERREVAGWVERCGARGVKFNVGNEPAEQNAYAERIAAWIDALPDGAALLCECHHGISIAEDPRVAREIFDAAGAPPARLQAIVHTHEEPDAIRQRFDAYGERITHVHVNFLDFEKGGAPRLSEVRGLLEARVRLLEELGFRGSYTLEFVSGLLTPNDEPGYLVERAAEDLPVLREVLR
jgi:sugar phosphate isomerase/epimerase